jgi:integrase
MASLFREKRGFRIQFTLSTRGRLSVRLGDVTSRVAQEIKRHVELLVVAAESKTPVEPSTAVWVGGIGDKLADQLHKAGLVERRVAVADIRAGNFADWFVERHAGLNPNSVKNYRQAARILAERIGPRTTLRSVTTAQAHEFVAGLRKVYKPATAARLVKFYRQFWTVAGKAGYVADNPFRDIKAGAVANPDRIEFISHEAIARVLHVCPDTEWQVIIVLARYGGLRIPSELAVLKWSDIDWRAGRITVRSPKTGDRVVPLFRELSEYLGYLRDETTDRTGHVISTRRRRASNLRTGFQKIIRRAGIEPWGRIFHNLRASRSMDLARVLPPHETAAYLGHSPAIALTHYQTVQDDDYERAVQKVVQKAVQTVAFPRSVTDGQTWTRVEKTLENERFCVTVNPTENLRQYTRRDSNPQPSVPKTDALSS